MFLVTNMRRVLYQIVAFLFTAISSCSAINASGNCKNCVSPYDFGLANAKSGIERYQVLLKTHNAAVSSGVDVDYTGIDTVRIEIPVKASRIPLTRYNDFKGCVFQVKNRTNNTWLFTIENKETPITVDKRRIDSGDFRSIDSLKHGRVLLLIEDENPWVLKRKGYSYGHQRRDILLIENGMAKNSVIMPYNNEFSAPKCLFIKLGKEPLVIKNIKIERDPSCTFLSHVAYISGFNDVQISNVSIHTPPSHLVDDRGIRIYNCTNITLDNVRIDGTYSQKKHSGYGISLGNVWNFRANRLYGRGNWGIFGNNNVNTAKIENSKINRFDIHCYGKDISFSHVDFFDRNNQFASVYGTISFDRCTFTDFVPVINGGSYNAYVAHNVFFNDCIFYATPSKNSIFLMRNMDDGPNARNELADKYWPNVSIKNLIVNMKEGTKDLYLFKNKVAWYNVPSIIHLSHISINGLRIVSDGATPVKSMAFSNIDIKTKKPIECSLSNAVVVQPDMMTKTTTSNDMVLLKVNIPVKDGKILLNNVRNIFPLK